MGLVGPNGAGKSTIMKCIVGIYPYSGGQIIFNGSPISRRTTGLMSSQIGSLIESPALYPFLTGWQHFKLEAVPKDNIDDVVKLLGMENYINDKVTSYSFGMKQKLGIALALIKHPSLVILDEPMNGLDLMATLDLRRIILTAASKGTTFIISSHILSELEKIVSDVILINKGRLVFQTTLDQLVQLGKQAYAVTTDDNQMALSLLREHGFEVKLANGALLVTHASDQLTEFLDLLREHHIRLLDISHQGLDLETATLHYISQSNGGDTDD